MSCKTVAQRIVSAKRQIFLVFRNGVVFFRPIPAYALVSNHVYWPDGSGRANSEEIVPKGTGFSLSVTDGFALNSCSRTRGPMPQNFTFSLDRDLATGAVQLDPSAHPELLKSLVNNAA